MAEEFKIALGVELNGDLSNIRAELTSLTSSTHHVNITLNDNRILTQINNIRTQLLDLQNINLNLNQNGGQRRGAVDEINRAYRQLQSIQQRISSKTAKIETLNLSKNFNQIEELRAQVQALQSEFEEIFFDFEDQFSGTQIDQIARSMDVLEEKISEVHAKMRDSISSGLETGEFQNQLDSLRSTYDGIGSENAQLVDSFDRVQIALNELQASELSDDFRQLFEVFGVFQTELANAEIALKNFKQQQVDALKIDTLESNRAILGQEIRIWMQENTASAQAFDDQLQRILRDLENCNEADLSRLSKEFKQIKNNVKIDRHGFDGIVNDLINDFGNIGNLISATEIIMYSFQAIKEGITTVKELDTALIDLKKTTEASAKELDNFYYEANDIAKKYGATTQEIIQSAADWSRLGFSLDDSKLMSQYSSMLKSISSDLNIDEATNGLVSIMKAYGIEAEDALDGIVSKINIVGNEFATSNGEIVAGLQNSAAAMAVMGTSLEETIALFTAAQEITQNASKVGNALRSMSMRIRGYDEETGEMSDTLSNITGEVIDLTKVASKPEGISLFTDETQTEYKSIYSYLQEISEIYDELGAKEQQELMEKLFGKNRASVGAAILKNFKAAEDSMEAMGRSAGNAEQEMTIITESIEYKLNALKETGTGIAQNLFPREVIGAAIDALTLLLNVVDKVTEHLGLFGTAFIAFNGISTFVSAFRSGQTALEAFGSALPSITRGINAFSFAAGNGFSTASAALQGFLATFNLSPTILAIAGAVAAIAGLIWVIDKLVVTASEANEAMELDFSEFEEATQKVESLNSELETTRDRINELEAKGGLTFVEQGELEKLKEAEKLLQLQLKNAEHQEEIKARESANSTVQAYKKNYATEMSGMLTDIYYDQGELNGYNGNYSSSLFYSDTNVSALIAGLRLLNEEQDNLEVGSKAWDNCAKKISDVEGRIWDNVDTLTDYQSKLEAIPESLRTDEQNQTLAAIKGNIEYIYKELDPATWKQMKLDDIMSNDTFATARDNLVQMAKDSDNVGVTVDDVRTKYKYLADEIERSGINLEDFVSTINAEAGIIDFDAIRSQLKSGFTAKTSQDRVGFDRWIGKLSDDDLKLIYEISLNTDTAEYTLKDWQEALDYYKSTYSDLDIDLGIESDNISNLKNARSESVSGSGLSQESINNIKTLFSDIEGYDYFELFERTSLGIQLNTDALSQLQKTYEETKKLEIQQELERLGAEYQKAAKKADDLTASEEDRNRAASQMEGYEKQIKELTEMQAMYDGLTNKFAAYQAALETANAGAIYDTIRDGYESAKDLFKQGLIGTDDFTSFVDLVSFGDVSDYSARFQELSQNIEGLDYSVADFFGEGSKGVSNFLKAVEQAGENAGETWAEFNETTGEWSFDFDVDTIAETLGVSVEFVESMLMKLQDYGFDIDFDPAVDSIEELVDSLDKVNEKYKDVQGFEPVTIEADVTDIDGLNSELEDAKTKYEEIKNSEIDPKVKTAQLEALEAKIELIYGLLNQHQYMKVDASQVQTEFTEAHKLLQQYDTAAKNLAVAKLKGDATEISDCEEKVNSLAQQIYNLPNEIKTGIGIEENADFDTVKSKLDDLNDTSITVPLITETEQTPEEVIAQFEDKDVTITISVAGQDLADNAKQTLSEIKESYPTEVNISTPGDDKLAAVKENLDGLKSWNVTVTTNVEGGEDVANVKRDIENIKSKSVTVTATTIGKAVLTSLKSAYDELKNKVVTITATTFGTDLVNALRDAIASVKDKTVKVKAKVSGKNDVDNLRNSINKLSSKTVTVTASVVGLDDMKTLKSIYDHLKDKTVKVTMVTVDGTGASADGTAHDNGTAFTNGTAYAHGDWRIGRNGISLGGELGPEILVRDGRWFTIGEHSAEFFAHKAGDIVFNAQQTKQILANGKITSGKKRGTAYVDGTAFASGTGTLPGDEGGSGGTGGNGGSGGDSGSSDDFKEKIDWIEILLDRIERAIEKLDTTANSIYKKWSTRNSAITDEIAKVAEEIEYQEQGYNRYIEEANKVGLSEKYAEKVRNGTIDISTITDENLAEKIKEYQEWYEKALDCKDAVVELNEKMSELYQMKFDNIVTEYDALISVIEREKNMVDEYISQSEERGWVVSTSYYDSMIQQEEQTQRELIEKRAKLQAALDEAVASGAIEEGSEAWYDMQEEIDNTTLAIEESETAIIEYNNAIREIQWDIFDMLREKIEAVTEEAEFLINLFANDKLFDDNGQLTAEGKATMGLHGMNYNAYMAEADAVAAEIAKIDEQLANDPYDQELIERKQDLIEQQQDFISAAEDEKQAIISLVQEGIELEITALQKLISEYSEALDSAKDLFDYGNKIKEQTEAIGSLEKQRLAYAGDTTEETRATLQKVMTSLKEAKETLEESEYERYIADQKKLLDDLSTEYAEILNQRLDDTNALISDAIESINNDAELIDATIKEKADSVGYTVSDAISSIWGSDSTKLSVYCDNFLSQATATNSALNTINSNMITMIQQLNRVANTNLSGAEVDSSVVNASEYGTGVYRLGAKETAWTQDGGHEMIIRPSDGAVLTPLEMTDSVLNPNATSNMWKMANDPSEFIRDNLSIDSVSAKVNTQTPTSYSQVIEQVMFTFPNVKNYEEMLSAMANDNKFERLIDAITINKLVGGSSLARRKSIM